MRGLGALLLLIGIAGFLVGQILPAEGVGVYSAGAARAYFYLSLFGQVLAWLGIAVFAGGAVRAAQRGARVQAYYQQAPMAQPAQMGQAYAPYAGAGSTTATMPAVTQQPTGPVGASTSASCQSCGAPLALGAAFCGNCGAKS